MQDQFLSASETGGRVCRVEQSWVDDRARQPRRLVCVEIGRARMEVGARSGLGAVDAVAPLDDVEVQLEDAGLLQLGLEPPRDDELFELPERIPRRRQIQIL